MKINLKQKMGILSLGVLATLTLLPATIQAAPVAPTTLTASAISGLNPVVTLAWVDAAANETGFHIQRSIDNFLTIDAVFTAAANAITFPDTTIQAGASYYYRVTSFDGTGDSAPTNTVSVAVPGGGSPFPLGPAFSLVTPAPAAPTLAPGAANAIAVSFPAAGPAIISTSWQLQPAVSASGFNAFEILEQTTPNLTPRAPAGTTITPNTTAFTGPAGSVVAFSIQGVATAVSAAGEWQIGTPAMVVYESGATVLTGAPVQGSEVIVSGFRALAGGPIVAQNIIMNAPAPQPVGAALVSTNLQLNGTVTTAGAATWTVTPAGAAPGTFNILSTPPTFISPAVTAAPGAVGKTVTVGFNAAAAAAASTGVNKAVSIAPQRPLDVLTPRNLTPIMDNTAVPVPPGTNSVVIMNITGVITAIDTATGTWQIGTPAVGSPQVTVYESPATLVRDFVAPPAIGQGVSIVAVRGVAGSPIVARSIRFAPGQAAGPANIDLTLQFNGTVTAATATSITVTPAGGAPVVFQMMAAADPSGLGPTLTESTLGAIPAVNTPVSVEYIIEGGAAQPNPAAWAPLALNAATSQWQGTVTPDAVVSGTGAFLFFQATDANGATNTVMFPVTLGAQVVTPPGGGGGGGFGGGGGGGGGGGFSGGSQLTGTGLLGVGPVMDTTGKTTSSGELKTADTRCTLTIPINTLITSTAGAAVFNISGLKMDAPPTTPANGKVIIAYEMGPTGVTFNPAMTMSIAYTDAEIPVDMPESSFYIARWDGAEWVKLTSTVDAANNKVTAPVDHFSSFGLMAQQPPPTTTVPPVTTTVPPVTTTVPPVTTTPVTTNPPPVTTTVPPVTTTQATTPAPTGGGNNTGLIIGMIAAVAVLGVVIFMMSRKKTT